MDESFLPYTDLPAAIQLAKSKGLTTSQIGRALSANMTSTGGDSAAGSRRPDRPRIVRGIIHEVENSFAQLHRRDGPEIGGEKLALAAAIEQGEAHDVAAELFEVFLRAHGGGFIAVLAFG
jgi:hypothetical protein